MPQIHDSKDVHRILIEEADHAWLLGLVAFALFEDRRFDWMKHFQEYNQRQPNSDEIKSWYQQQSQRVIEDVIADAETALSNYGDDILQETVDDIKKETERGVIVSEIRNLKNGWADFGLNVAGGVAGAFLFAALLVILVAIIYYDPSPVKMMQDYMNPPNTESKNGNENQ